MSIDENEKKKLIRKKYHFFERYINDILKCVEPNKNITLFAKQQLNSAICIIADLCSHNISIQLKYLNKKTISEKEVFLSFKNLLKGELCNNTISEGKNAIYRFNVQTNINKSRQVKSSIIFPPSIAELFLRKNKGYLIGKYSPIAFASGLEYIASEILRCSCLSILDEHKRITIMDIANGIYNDEELSELFLKNNIILLGYNPLFLFSNIKFTFKLYIPKSIFIKNIRNRMIIDNLKINKDVFVILQHFIEYNIIELIIKCKKLAYHCNRQEIYKSDVDHIMNK
jgi:hypothetical protein